MKLLTLLIVLGIEHWRPLGRFVHRDGWFTVIQNWADHNILASGMRYVCAVLIPAAVMALFVLLLKNALWGAIGFLLHIVVLLYVLGRGQLTQSVEIYLSDWRRGDLQGATHQAQELFGVDSTSVENGIALHHCIRNRVLSYGLTDFFAVVFWYLIAGILGALVSFLTKLYVMNASGDAKTWALKSVEVIEWLPTRLLGLTFAVAGNFGTCFGEWVERIVQTKMSNIDFLSACGISAIGLTDIIEEEDIRDSETGEPSRDYLYKSEQEIRALLALIERSRYVWIAIVAVAIVLGWL